METRITFTYSSDIEKTWNLGMHLYQEEKYSQALEHFDAVINFVNSNNVRRYDYFKVNEKDDLYFNRGMAYRALDQFKQATDDFYMAIQINSSHAHYHFQLAEACYAEAKSTQSISLAKSLLDKAHLNLQAAIERDPHSEFYIASLLLVERECANNIKKLNDLNHNYQQDLMTPNVAKGNQPKSVTFGENTFFYYDGGHAQFDVGQQRGISPGAK